MYEDEELEPTDKFDECHLCRNKWKFLICQFCTVGEEFEELDMDEVDKYFDGRI